MKKGDAVLYRAIAHLGYCWPERITDYTISGDELVEAPPDKRPQDRGVRRLTYDNGTPRCLFRSPHAEVQGIYLGWVHRYLGYYGCDNTAPYYEDPDPPYFEHWKTVKLLVIERLGGERFEATVMCLPDDVREAST